MEPGNPVKDPLFQETPKPSFSEVGLNNSFSLKFIYVWLIELVIKVSFILCMLKKQAMEACPKKEIPNFKELLKEENFYLTTEVYSVKEIKKGRVFV